MEQQIGWQNDAWNNGWMDQRNEPQMDIPSHRDVWKHLKKFGTNNDASWMKEDENEDEDEGEDSLLTSKEPFMIITKLILAKFNL